MIELLIPDDWRFPAPRGLTVHRRPGDAPALDIVREALERGMSHLVAGADGVGDARGWLLATDHISLFGDSPLAGPNRDDLGPRFPSVSRLYAAPEGSWMRGVVLRVPDWRLSTPAELSFSGAAAAVSCGVEEALVAGHGGAGATLLVRCHGRNSTNRSEAPLEELLKKLTGGSSIG